MVVTGDGAAPIDVTVVIPVRNGGGDLLRSIKSVERVAMASGSAVEVVVVDDGADVPLAPSLAVGHVRIPVTVVEGPQDGPSVARNEGVRVARGRYLSFLDVDDVVLPAWTALLRAAVGPERASDAAPAPAAPAAVRGACIVEDVVGGSRTALGPSWMPAAYLVEAAAFGRVGGFDERVRYGEHHQLGGRVAATDGARVIDVPDAGPVMVKLDDRSSEQRLGYAARRHEAALLELEAATDAAGRAAASDTASVSLARLGEWRGARSAAVDAWRDGRNAKRLVRVVLMSAPGVRHGWFVARLSATDRVGRVRRSVDDARTAATRAASLGAALARGARRGGGRAGEPGAGDASGPGSDLR